MTRSGARTVRIETGPEAAGQRLDQVLAARLDGCSRSRVQVLIRAGYVRDPERTLVDPSAKIKSGQVLIVDLPAPEPAAPAGEDIALRIVFEDADLIVVDKPAGLVVHPSAGHRTGTLVNALIGHCGDSLAGIAGVRRPGIVHRIDKDTSGLLVVAKTDVAYQGLQQQFANTQPDRWATLERIALQYGAAKIIAVGLMVAEAYQSKLRNKPIGYYQSSSRF